MKSFLKGLLGVLAVIAVVWATANFRRLHRPAEAGVRVWFYNQSTQRLYAAPRSLIPPDGNDDTRVRATVIGFKGMPDDPSQLKIAYLEKYSQEYKALLQRAEAAHAALKPFTEKIPSASSAYGKENTFVKRPGEPVWHPAGTPEAREIIGEWHAWHGPAGQAPIVSVPSMD